MVRGRFNAADAAADEEEEEEEEEEEDEDLVLAVRFCQSSSHSKYVHLRASAQEQTQNFLPQFGPFFLTIR